MKSEALIFNMDIPTINKPVYKNGVIIDYEEFSEVIKFSLNEIMNQGEEEGLSYWTLARFYNDKRYDEGELVESSQCIVDALVELGHIKEDSNKWLRFHCLQIKIKDKSTITLLKHPNKEAMNTLYEQLS